MEEDNIFTLVGVLGFAVAVIALLLFLTINSYTFDEGQFIVNNSNVSINSSILGNNSYYNNTYVNQTINATVNTTQFDSNNPISIKMSWLQSMIEYFAPAPDLSNYYNKSTSDNRFCFANGTNSQGLECGESLPYNNITYISPLNGSVYININEFPIFNATIGVSSTDEYMYLNDNEAPFSYGEVELGNLVEGLNNWTAAFEVGGQEVSGSVQYFYYYSDIQSLADATEEHNVKSTWLEDIKDWILDIARTLFYEKDSNINATGYNITADYFIGNGSQLTGLSEQPFAQQGRLSLPQLASATYLIEEIPGWAFSGQTNSIKAVSAWLVPIYVSRSVSYRGFRYDIYSTTGKTADSYRVGIYDVDYSTGLPKNLVWDSGKQTFETTTGAKQVIGLNIVLTEGWYYIVGTKNGNINLYGSSPAQQRPPLGGFGTSTTKQILTSTTADWTNGFPNPWVNTGFSHMNTDGYEASFFKLYRNSEA